MTRRLFFFGSLASTALPQKRNLAKPKILVILIDGFDPSYLDASDTPNMKRLGAQGSFKIGRSVIPSVTNVNNASLVTGSFPDAHGITSNFWRDRATGKTGPMESSEFVRKPTIFELAQKRGWRSAMVTAKDKVRTLCAKGASIAISAEQPPPEYIDRIGKRENMYSPDVNYWAFRAARYLLKQGGVDLMYLSTTDYMMHTYAPTAAQSLEHMHTLDGLLGEIVADHPGIEVYLTADHGMNAKREAVDLARVLQARSIAAEAIPIIRDKHTVHHQNLGGACYIYLDRPADEAKAAEFLKATAGVEDVYDRPTAARLFHLEAGRIGDLFVLGSKEVVFGDLEQMREPTTVRSHGSRHESRVPIIVYGRKVDWSKYEYNLDLTKHLVREWV